MNDHRKLQRTLFRMQLDPDFARAVFEREPAALASTELCEEDLRLLLRAPSAAVGADREGRRKAQFLRNVASELPLACALLEELEGTRVLEGFATAPEFHDAIAHAGRLPRAFAAYAGRRARELGQRAIGALVELESALIEARRTTRALVALACGEVVLAPHVHLRELDEGTFAHAAQVRLALDARAQRALPQRPPATSASETVLIAAKAPMTRHSLREVEVELLAPPVVRLLRFCSQPVGPSARAHFARERAVEPADVEGFVDALVAERLLVRADRAR